MDVNYFTLANVLNETADMNSTGGNSGQEIPFIYAIGATAVLIAVASGPEICKWCCDKYYSFKNKKKD